MWPKIWALLLQITPLCIKGKSSSLQSFKISSSWSSKVGSQIIEIICLTAFWKTLDLQDTWNSKKSSSWPLSGATNAMGKYFCWNHALISNLLSSLIPCSLGKEYLVFSLLQGIWVSHSYWSISAHAHDLRVPCFEDCEHTKNSSADAVACLRVICLNWFSTAFVRGGGT